jgi:hypothetical protein
MRPSASRFGDDALAKWEEECRLKSQAQVGKRSLACSLEMKPLPTIDIDGTRRPLGSTYFLE